MVDPQNTFDRLLAELEGGNAAVVDELFAHVYGALKELAHRQRRRWQGDYTLNTTVLLHEAYLKLVDQERIRVESRAHFFALAARAMRQILCNYARDQRAQKRGGGVERVPLDASAAQAASSASLTADASDAVVLLDDALRRLEQIDPRQSRVIECRFFGGLTVEETAMALGISQRTVKRDWAVAQAWLHREMTTSHEH